GSRIAAKALEEGRKVRCLVRDLRRGAHLRELGAELVEGDILKPESLAEAVRGATAAIHLVGIISERRGETFDEVHYRGTVNVVEALKGVSVQRYLHMSALGVRPGAQSLYHQSKWRAEEYVRESGLRYTIFRPSIIFGERDEFINLLARLVRLAPVVPILGSGRTLLQPIWVEDVAFCFIKALDVDGAVGKTFELVGPERVSLEDLVDTLLQVLRRSRVKVHIPLGLAELGARAMECLLSRPPLTRDQLLMLSEDNVGEGEPMRATFGLEPRRLEDYLEAHL
ncbi:MAG: complex I NDUFA9 subunit family protein, partial [Nitrospinota bacterium]